MKVVKAVLAVILAIVLMIAIAFGSGMLNMTFYEFFGMKKANIERKIFKENKSHVEGMISDLAKYKYELAIEKDEIAKNAIRSMIRSKYANFDETKIEDYALKAFLIQIRGGY